MHAVIMAGGKGTRLASITGNEIPKPMVPIKGEPLLLWQLKQLKKYGINRVTMITGYLGDKITGYFGDGSAFGFKIDYIEEKEPLGTAGALYYLKDRLESRHFLLLFGDIFFNIDIDRMERFHIEKSAAATLFVHPNSHPFDSDLISTDKDCKVLGFDSKNNTRDYWYDNMVNAGIYILDKSICDRVKAPVKTDFEKDILADMALCGEAIYAYRSPEYVKDVGTVERIESAVKELESGLTEAKNLRKKQRAVFLDRDGTLNVLKGFISREEDFELEKGAVEAVKAINASGRLAIVISNQPVIARGESSLEELENIHNKLKTLLGREGAYLDDIFYCPHHPDKGFEGEREEYKIDCDCRKPKTGMIMLAAEKYNIDIAASWVIGDSSMDMELGRRAGAHTALVATGAAGNDGKFSAKADVYAENVLDAVNKLLAD